MSNETKISAVGNLIYCYFYEIGLNETQPILTNWTHYENKYRTLANRLLGERGGGEIAGAKFIANDPSSKSTSYHLLSPFST